MCNQACQSTQTNKFAISLQYLKKDVSDENDFLHTNKHKGLLQIDTMILMEIVRHYQNSQNSKFSMSLQYLKEKVRDKVDFGINFNVSCKLIQHFGHQCFLESDTINDIHDQVFSNYSK